MACAPWYMGITCARKTFFWLFRFRFFHDPTLLISILDVSLLKFSKNLKIFFLPSTVVHGLCTVSPWPVHRVPMAFQTGITFRRKLRFRRFSRSRVALLETYPGTQLSGCAIPIFNLSPLAMLFRHLKIFDKLWGRFS